MITGLLGLFLVNKIDDRLSFSVVHLSPFDPELYLTVIAVLDPLAPETQRFAPILQALHAALSMDVTIYLNPVAKLSQLPMTRSEQVIPPSFPALQCPFMCVSALAVSIATCYSRN